MGSLKFLPGTLVHTLNMHEGNALASLDVSAYIRLYIRCPHLLLNLKYDKLAHLFATCVWGKQKRRAEHSLINVTVRHFSVAHYITICPSTETYFGLYLRGAMSAVTGIYLFRLLLNIIFFVLRSFLP